jgi:hypothetical protein
MSVTSGSAEEAPTQITPASETPTTSLLSQSNPDSCPHCGAAMASDQRYCVECGTRRGKPRFSLASAAGAPPATTPAVAANAGGAHSSTLVLLSTVGVLLLAVFLGVNIGQSGGSSGRQPIRNVVNLGGGASSGTGDTASSGSAGSAAAANTAPKVKETGSEKSAVAKADQRLAKAHISTKPITAATATKINNAVAKTLGKNAKTLTPATTKVGSKCTDGQAGCVNGVYTGNPFG